MVKVIVLIISVLALALIVRFIFKLRGLGEAVEIDLRDIEGWRSEKSSTGAGSKDIAEAVRD